MLKFSIIYVCIVIVLQFSIGEFADGSPVDINKEIPELPHSSLSDGRNELIHFLSDALRLSKMNNRPEWIVDSYSNRIARRSIDELNALLNDANDAEILNLPLRSLDQEKLQNSPFLQFIASRKQKKRNHDYNPRLGRSSLAASSAADDDDNNQALPAPRNSNQALFAPRLGKKSLEFSPRLGRSFYSE